jgi:hypothetical protein
MEFARKPSMAGSKEVPIIEAQPIMESMEQSTESFIKLIQIKISLM